MCMNYNFICVCTYTFDGFQFIKTLMGNNQKLKGFTCSFPVTMFQILIFILSQISDQYAYITQYTCYKFLIFHFVRASFLQCFQNVVKNNLSTEKNCYGIKTRLILVIKKKKEFLTGMYFDDLRRIIYIIENTKFCVNTSNQHNFFFRHKGDISCCFGAI